MENGFQEADALTAISTLQEIKRRTSAHMLRVCATDELFQVGIALVSQVLVNADRGSVIAINSQTLNSNKETFLDRPRSSLIPADHFE